MLRTHFIEGSLESILESIRLCWGLKEVMEGAQCSIRALPVPNLQNGFCNTGQLDYQRPDRNVILRRRQKEDNVKVSSAAHIC